MKAETKTTISQQQQCRQFVRAEVHTANTNTLAMIPFLPLPVNQSQQF